MKQDQNNPAQDGANNQQLAIQQEAPMFATAVTLKLPPYWPSDPQVWFVQVEAQFTRNITSQKMKFDYIVASLAPEFAQEVRDLILRLQVNVPYNVLKETLISHMTASEQR